MRSHRRQIGPFDSSQGPFPRWVRVQLGPVLVERRIIALWAVVVRLRAAAELAAAVPMVPLVAAVVDGSGNRDTSDLSLQGSSSSSDASFCLDRLLHSTLG